jgi:hypothetical protein
MSGAPKFLAAARRSSIARAAGGRKSQGGENDGSSSSSTSSDSDASDSEDDASGQSTAAKFRSASKMEKDGSYGACQMRALVLLQRLGKEIAAGAPVATVTAADVGLFLTVVEHDLQVTAHHWPPRADARRPARAA